MSKTNRLIDALYKERERVEELSKRQLVAQDKFCVQLLFDSLDRIIKEIEEPT